MVVKEFMTKSGTLILTDYPSDSNKRASLQGIILLKILKRVQGENWQFFSN